MKNVKSKREQEKYTVNLMIKIYCCGVHKSKRGELCDSCRELAEYASQRTDKCPFMESKTFCSLCKVHCYKPEMRERIREAMRYAGPRMIFHNPYLAFRHLYLMQKEKRKIKAEEKKNAK